MGNFFEGVLLNQARTWFPKIDLVRMSVACVFVCVRPRGY